jgi:ssRNA-specific RNase YbeY (16S rRNA maturation enzyme)
LRNINVHWSGVDTVDVLSVPLSSEERDCFMPVTGDVLVWFVSHAPIRHAAY